MQYVQPSASEFLKILEKSGISKQVFWIFFIKLEFSIDQIAVG